MSEENTYQLKMDLYSDLYVSYRTFKVSLLTFAVNLYSLNERGKILTLQPWMKFEFSVREPIMPQLTTGTSLIFLFILEKPSSW